MLRLAPLQLLQPGSPEAVTALLREQPGARLLAGGTDLLPALKTGQIQAETVVALGRVLPRQVEIKGERLEIGAGITLAALSAHPLIRQWAPALAEAASLVASPLIRNRATLGGNLCLEPRCRYLNQSPLFRQALGGCLKSHGQECHVVVGATRCLAALSADTVPPLLAYRARVHCLGSEGERSLQLKDLYRGDGLQPLTLHPGEWIERVSLPRDPKAQVVYRKWRARQSIDFPLVSLALRLDVEAGRLQGGLLAVGALGPKPRQIELRALQNAKLDADLPDRVAEQASALRPLANLPYDPEYRRRRLLLEIRRAVRQWL